MKSEHSRTKEIGGRKGTYESQSEKNEGAQK